MTPQQRCLSAGKQAACRADKRPRLSACKRAIGGYVAAIAFFGLIATTSSAQQPAAKLHWAYGAPRRPALPLVQHTDWPRNAIDRFILARLERERLQPSPSATPHTLMRRLYLDLIGLPPSPREVEQFAAECRVSDSAYRIPHSAVVKLVDRLLASPHFGEKWARPWLDLARYADSHGFQRDDLRTIWPYRDWVIRALNADMPYDRFTIEQIAGDLLPNATIDQRVATGFHRCTPTNVEAGSEPEETRVNQVFDRVSTTAAVWLGTTLECAQCHDHKYDPFTMRDFYRLFAFFNSTAIEADRSNPKVPGSIRFLGPALTLNDTATDSRRGQLAAELTHLDSRLAARSLELGKNLDAWAKKFAVRLGGAGQIHVLKPSEFSSSAASPHKVLDDGSILLTDDPPDRDTYTIVVHTKLTGITGFRLETLTDPSLPGEGPGRGDKSRPNFVLNRFTVKSATTNGIARPVRLVRALADVSQANYNVAGAIDNKPKTAWAIAPQFHKSHWAIFVPANPAGFAGGTTFTFTLVQNFGRGRTIGRLRLAALTGPVDDVAVPADVSAILTKPAKRSPAETKRLLDFRIEHDEASRKLQGERAQIAQAIAKLSGPSTLVMQELAKPRPTAIFQRGDYRTQGEAVTPGVPAILPPLPSGLPNRLTLARWLAARDNPLAARVAVNRVWAELFGRGIVATPEDFGSRGEPPTHPELLDWLAVEYMDGGWSLKKLLRTIVLSSTYRQSSRITPLLRERDDQNKLYARGPRFRLDAEMIRDNALAAAGLLSRAQYGAPVRPYQPDGLWTKIGGEKIEYVVSPGAERYRRGIYTVWKRAAPYPSFVAFDATARLACTVRRSRTNTPLQALTLLNDPVYVEAAQALARRIIAESPSPDLQARIRYGFRLCLAREPRDAEIAILKQLIGGATGGEEGAWYNVAAALLNLDEMITKE